MYKCNTLLDGFLPVMVFQFLTLSLAEKTLSMTDETSCGVGRYVPICLTVYTLLDHCSATVSSRSSGCESIARSIHEVVGLI